MGILRSDGNFVIGTREEIEAKNKILNDFLYQLGVEDYGSDDLSKLLELKAYEWVRDLWNNSSVWSKIYRELGIDLYKADEIRETKIEGRLSEYDIIRKILKEFTREFKKRFIEEYPKLKEALNFRFYAIAVAIGKALIDYYGKNPLELIKEKVVSDFLKEEKNDREEKLIKGDEEPTTEYEKVKTLVFRALRGITFDVKEEVGKGKVLLLGGQKYTIEDAIGRRKLQPLISRIYHRIRNKKTSSRYEKLKEEDRIQVVKELFSSFSEVYSTGEILSSIKKSVENNETWEDVMLKLFTLSNKYKDRRLSLQCRYNSCLEREFEELQKLIVKKYGTNSDYDREYIGIYLLSPNPFYNVVGELSSSLGMSFWLYNLDYYIKDALKFMRKKVEGEEVPYEIDKSLDKWEALFRKNFDHLWKEYGEILKEVLSPNVLDKLKKWEEMIFDEIQKLKQKEEEKLKKEEETAEILEKKMKALGIDDGDSIGIGDLINKTKEFLGRLFKP
jgi:hypothetical protein